MTSAVLAGLLLRQPFQPFRFVFSDNTEVSGRAEQVRHKPGDRTAVVAGTHDAELTPEQRAAAEARRAERQTPQYQDELARDIEAYRQEYPPVGDPELIEALTGLRRERERQGLSLTEIAERTGIDRATISKLETGKLANPTIGTLRTYAKALGRRLTLVDHGTSFCVEPQRPCPQSLAMLKGSPPSS